MRLYEYAPESNYAELKTFYPNWYGDFLEADVMWKALGKQLDAVQRGIIRVVDNNFIYTADAETLTQIEMFLHIPRDETRTLNDRRRMIASFFIGGGHIGAREITAIVSQFTNGRIAVALVGGTIEISVEMDPSDKLNLADCIYVLRTRIPAHLGIAFNEQRQSSGAVVIGGITEVSALLEVFPEPIELDSAGNAVFAGYTKCFSTVDVYPNTSGGLIHG